MKYLIISLFALTVSALVGCSDDNPADSGNGDPVDDALATATIGPGGGELVYEDFVLTVPAGSFPSEATLGLYDAETAHPLEQQGCTDVYRLEGVLEFFNMSLGVRIRHSDSLVDNSYILVGGTVENAASGQTHPSFAMLEATDSSGFLSATIPPGVQIAPAAGGSVSLSSGYDDALPIYLVGTSGYEPPLDTGEFRFVFPNGLNPNARNFLARDFCESVDSLEAVGFSFDNVPKPIEVYVYYFATPEAPEICLFMPSWGRFCLSFDRWALEDWYNTRDNVRYAAIRECVHIAACTYDNSYFNVLTSKRAIFNPERFWLHQAAACCLEEKQYLPDPQFDFQPMELDVNAHDERKESFAGLQPPPGCTILDSRYHGSGMSALIKHMTNNYGDGIIWSLYERVDLNDLPATAVLNVFSDAPNVWYPEFVKDYVRGDIYGGPFSGSSLYEEDVSGAFAIAGSGDTLQTFTDSYSDISARVYVIDMDYASIDTISLSISSSNASNDNMHLLVFAYKDATTDPYLTEAAQEVTIPDALALKANGYNQLWAVVVNSGYTAPNYDGSCDITLQARAVLREELPFNRCLPWFDLYCYFTEIAGGDPPDTSQLEGDFWPNWEPVVGSFSGLTFSATWNTVDYYDNPYSGNMEIILDPTYDTVLSFDVNATIQRNIQQIEKISITGFNLPLTESATQYKRFKVSTSAACSHITEITDTLFTTEPSKIKTLDSITCVTANYVEVYFYTAEE